jgi:hypothetical protein
VGYEQPRTVVLYFVQDSAGSIAFVATFNKRNIDTGTCNAGLIIDSPDLKNDGTISFLLQDDTGPEFSDAVGQPCDAVWCRVAFI